MPSYAFGSLFCLRYRSFVYWPVVALQTKSKYNFRSRHKERNRMSKIRLIYLPVFMILLLTACSTAFHGSFVANTYINDNSKKNTTPRGLARGDSCQTRVLYLFPAGESPSTQEAIQLAIKQHEETEYLANVTVENRTEWEFGYLRQCTTVTGTAY